MQVFAERGYRDASMDEIVGRAGYSKGALYWHFSSKEDLFFALLEERVIPIWQEGISVFPARFLQLGLSWLSLIQSNCFWPLIGFRVSLK